MYLYELQEGDDDLGIAVLVAHETEYDETEFLELVVEARREVFEQFEEDTLVEAVAKELARRHGFLPLDDTQLRAAVSVSANEEETRLAPLEEGSGRSRGDEEDEEDEFRSLLVDIEPDDAVWRRSN